ncbi:MAG TPA: sigma-70 family RNA polymerase sigma factor, partial [Flavitalea sp.]|nr:sigma-70 family RNA polymerase sigma factor [Flavitalea sp.]
NFRKEQKKPGKKPISRIEFEIPDMSDPNDRKENKNILHMAIEKLSEIEKAIIMLYLDEKTYDEISEIAGISVSNVGVRINRIKIKLSTIVKTY